MNVLVVVDMQNDFITEALGTKEAEKILPKVVEKVDQFEGAVVFTQDTHEPDYLMTQEGKKLPVTHCIVGSEGWELASELKELAAILKAPVVRKPTFGSLELIQVIDELASKKDENIDSIELVGLCTDICVISNALILKAAFPEVKISVCADCCAGVTVESHKNALEAMRMCQIEIV